MSNRLVPAVIVTLGAVGFVACEGGVPTGGDTRSFGEHAHDGPTLEALYQNETRPEVRAQINELGRVTARYHNIKHAVADGYDANVGCIDETVTGLTPADARGMGYHVTKSAGIVDGTVNFLEPEFLVFAPHPRDADLPADQRVGKATLIGVEYFVPGLPDDPNPPELFGETFDYNYTFSAWVRHIYLWGNNPEGIYENYNEGVPLCTQLLAGEPIG